MNSLVGQSVGPGSVCWNIVSECLSEASKLSMRIMDL
jgi:hypothetical protein